VCVIQLILDKLKFHVSGFLILKYLTYRNFHSTNLPLKVLRSPERIAKSQLKSTLQAQLASCLLISAEPRKYVRDARHNGILADKNRSPVTEKPRLISLFSGCGGMDLGFQQAGYQVVWANDFNLDASKTYVRNFGPHMNHGPIEEMNLDNLPNADGVIGGFPCQDFSMIWKRGGIETERGNLYTYFVKAVESVKPKFFIAENVKGLVTANSGKAIKRIVEDFARLGYAVSWDVYNFADYGVPQLRQRVLIVGIRSDLQKSFERPAKTHTPENYLTSGEALIGVERVEHNNEYQKIKDRTRNILEAIPPGGNFTSIPKDSDLYVRGMISHVYRRLDSSKPSTTIIAGGGGGTWGYHFNEPRPLTNRERARLFGYPDDFVFEGTITEVRRQIGNSVPPPAAKMIANAIKNLL
jgi:DNA (cytosine-5)-methyltransferase 1